MPADRLSYPSASEVLVLDINHAPRNAVPMWGEGRWGGCFNPDENVGLFLHAGRLRGHLDWWGMNTVIYLPGQRVAVERSWARDREATGVVTGPLAMRVTESGWKA